jgi:hypothetical protein
MGRKGFLIGKVKIKGDGNFSYDSYKMAPSGWFWYEREMMWTWADELDSLPAIGYLSCSYINDSD